MIKIGAMIKLDSDQTNPSDQITPPDQTGLLVMFKPLINPPDQKTFFRLLKPPTPRPNAGFPIQLFVNI